MDAQYQINNDMFARLAQDDETAFAKLVHAIYKKLFPFTVSLSKSEAETDDILQEVFLKIWLHRATLAGMENPMGWVFTVIANTTSNHLRSRLRHELRTKQFGAEMSVTEDLEDKLDARFMQSLVDEAVDQLPAKRRQVFLLSKRDGLSRKEIALRLHISENTVRNQLVEAVSFVHHYLRQKGEPIIPCLCILYSGLKNFF